MISIITLNKLKKDLLKVNPKYGIRLFFDNGDVVFTELNKGIIVIIEINFLIIH